MRSKVFIGILLLFAVSGAFGQRALIKDLAGTVEVKQPGASAREKAVQGQTIEGDTAISTGFKSNALIGIGSSVINVRPLTRLSFKEIRATAGTETISVGLQAGRVRLDLNPPVGAMGAYTVQTPPATASVRGTVFEMGIFELWVIEGSVEYRGTSGPSVIVDAVGYSYVDEKTGRAVLAKDMLLESLDPSQPIAFDSFHSFRGAAAQQTREIDVTGGMGFD